MPATVLGGGKPCPFSPSAEENSECKPDNSGLDAVPI